jgi:hypothetical protein
VPFYCQLNFSLIDLFSFCPKNYKTHLPRGGWVIGIQITVF